jgi:hypothetical protein
MAGQTGFQKMIALAKGILIAKVACEQEIALAEEDELNLKRIGIDSKTACLKTVCLLFSNRSDRTANLRFLRVSPQLHVLVTQYHH